MGFTFFLRRLFVFISNSRRGKFALAPVPSRTLPHLLARRHLVDRKTSSGCPV
jgi:hypothetical protein